MPNHNQYIKNRGYYKKLAKAARIRYKDKYKQYDIDRYKKRKEQLNIIMKELKINGCAICGYIKCKDALVFHHVNPEEKCFSLTIQYLRLKDYKIIDELNKCILLCANCHREIHHLERTADVV